MNRRKKRLARMHELPKLNPPGVRYPATVKASTEKSKHEYICEDCEQIGEDKINGSLFCLPYLFVPSAYIRLGCCPFNRTKTVTKKQKVRVGQQKTKRTR